MNGMLGLVVSVFRGAVSLSLFCLFGVGALLITPVVAVLRSPNLCQPVVRAAWRVAAWLFQATGLIRVESSGFGSFRGCVVVANHPSLIDVLLIVVLAPRTLFVAKSGLLRNPFLSTIVRCSAMPDDEHLPDVAAPYLADGWNVLIFPEGTRSPSPGEMREFRRGAAQLALRAGADVVCVGIRMSRPLLGKRQMPWDMGRRRVVYTFVAAPPTRAALDPSRGLRPQSAELTALLRSRVAELVAGANMV